jgi:hypothetical protein
MLHGHVKVNLPLLDQLHDCQRTCPVGGWDGGVRQSSQLHPLTEVRHNHPTSEGVCLNNPGALSFCLIDWVQSITYLFSTFIIQHYHMN